MEGRLFHLLAALLMCGLVAANTIYHDEAAVEPSEPNAEDLAVNSQDLPLAPDNSAVDEIPRREPAAVAHAAGPSEESVGRLLSRSRRSSDCVMSSISSNYECCSYCCSDWKVCFNDRRRFSYEMWYESSVKYCAVNDNNGRRLSSWEGHWQPCFSPPTGYFLVNVNVNN